MKMNRVTLIPTVMALAALTGCTETTSSANVKTAGIAALIEATATSSTSTTVRATLKVGGDESNTYVILDQGDQLFAETGGDRRPMTAQSDGVYEAEFAKGDSGTEFTVDLQRENDTPAPNSRGVLPKPFTPGNLSGTTVVRGEDVKITWDAGGDSDPMKIELDGDCIFPHSVEVGDTGSATISGDDIEALGSKSDKSCTVVVKLTRTRNGSADSAFDPESWFRLSQVRSTKFTSAPAPQ